MNSTPIVQLLPWVHDFETVHHASIIDQIRKIPKNSVLFMEESDLGIDFLAGLKEAARRNNFEKFYHLESRGMVDILQRDSQHPSISYLRNLREGGQASFEVIEEARKRNLKIIGLDTSMSRVKTNKAIGLALSTQNNWDFANFIGTTYERDVVFAQTVAKNIQKLGKKKVFLLCGSAHLPGLVEELTKMKIPFNLSTVFLGREERLKFFDTYRLNTTARNFYKKGNFAAIAGMVPILLKDRRDRLTKRDRFGSLKERMNYDVREVALERRKRKMQKKVVKVKK